MNFTSPRTLLVLGRAAGLPTVWSNCLAGWLLGGGGNFWKLPFLFLGASLFYTGGNFLNDAFDAETDRHRRAERPIPSGKISATMVWKFGFAQLGIGVLFLCFCGKIAALAAVLLALTILLYNFLHQFFIGAPWLLGACRFWIYVIAGSSSADGLNGFPIFCGAALAFYIAGSSFVARNEKMRGKNFAWSFLLLGTPVIFAMLMNTGFFLKPAIWISAVLVLWIMRCVKNIFLGGETNAPWMAANLFAGIIFVDWLAVAPVLQPLTGILIFLGLFGLTKLLQKTAPVS
jgi:UbiA prenyltransferase family